MKIRFFFACVISLCYFTILLGSTIDQIAPREIDISTNSGVATLGYYSNFDLGEISGDFQTVLINIHGSGRDAKFSYETLLNAVSLANYSEKSLVIAPQFLNEDDFFQLELSDNYLYYSTNPQGWARGSNALNQQNPLSSYAVLDSIISRVVNNASSVCEIIIMGHSAGGQFVNRYSATNNIENSIQAKFKYIVANPSSYVYLNDERVVSGTFDEFEVFQPPSSDCIFFDNWKFGLNNLSFYPYVNSQPIDTILNNMYKRKIDYLVGELDTGIDNLEMNCSAVVQGGNRYERSIIYFNYLRYFFELYYGFDIEDNSRHKIVPLVGHSASGMFLSSIGLSSIFSKNIDEIESGWKIQEGITTNNSLRDVFFTDNVNGWICGINGSIFRTEDGGQTWNEPDSVMGTTDAGIRSIFFVDNLLGYATRNSGKILKTIDGGDNWITISIDEVEVALEDVKFINSLHGWSLGENGVILITLDGGINWEVQQSNTFEDLRKSFFVDENTGFIVGNNGTALKTINGGETWFQMFSGISTTLRNVFFANENLGWIVGHDGLILKTEDGGQIWRVMDSFSDDFLRDVHFKGKTGWAVGSNGAILYSNDFGETWYEQLVETNERLWGVHVIDEQNVWSVGENGVILNSKRRGGSCTVGINLPSGVLLRLCDTITVSALNSCDTDYALNWSNGDSGPEISLLGTDLPSDYSTLSVIASDENGCIDSALVEIGLIEFDMDGDGFNSCEDCDDLNENINPLADEIPNNDIDENCDGEFTTTSLNENIDIGKRNVLFPNPVSNKIFFRKVFRGSASYKIYNSLGILLESGLISSDLQSIDVSEFQSGTLFVQLYYQEVGHIIIEKVQKY